MRIYSFILWLNICCCCCCSSAASRRAETTMQQKRIKMWQIFKQVIILSFSLLKYEYIISFRVDFRSDHVSHNPLLNLYQIFIWFHFRLLNLDYKKKKMEDVQQRQQQIQIRLFSVVLDVVVVVWKLRLYIFERSIANRNIMINNNKT